MGFARFWERYSGGEDRAYPSDLNRTLDVRLIKVRGESEENNGCQRVLVKDVLYYAAQGKDWNWIGSAYRNSISR